MYCNCTKGYSPKPDAYPDPMCQDVNECVESPPDCGPRGTCTNTPGSYTCSCPEGFSNHGNSRGPCEDVNECEVKPPVCGPRGTCTNTPGSYTCSCPERFSNHGNNSTGPCEDVDECVESPPDCGQRGTCTNTPGSYVCSCPEGFSNHGNNSTGPCEDVDECVETPPDCGPRGTCTNTPGSYTCSCPEGREKEGETVDWSTDSDVECKLDLLNSSMSKTLSQMTVSSLLDVLLETPPDRLASKGDAVLQSAENLVSTLVKPTPTQSSTNFSTNTTVVEILSVGPNSSLTGVRKMVTANISLDIDLLGIAQNNNGSASVVFMVYKSMHEALNASFFKTEDSKYADMMSNVISIILPKTQNTTLPRPVNISIQHLRPVGLGNELWCVYWNVTAWIKDGCHVSANNSTRTVCSCEHLSTFALIMTVDQKLKSDSKMDVLNTVLVLIGLVFLTLAVMTFVLCRWNPRVSNVARLNLCVCLLLAHTLFLLTQSFLGQIRIHQVLCRILAGVQHFLFLCSFMWMSIEAVMLFLSVRKLRQVKASDRAGLHWKINLLIGYGIPLFIVGVSAGVKPDGHGSEDCWLKDGVVWSFLGPVCFLLAVNIILFLTIIITLQSTLKEARSDVSKVKYTRVLLLKITLQCMVLGCPWVLGIFSTSSPVLEVLFLFLTSQQGTAIFLIHCLLNTEVRRQYRVWWQRFGPSSKQPESETATVSISLTQQPTSTTTATSRVA
ncbi:hypothetical protein ACEWY4_017414 [Coilia grayii]|uniref:Adhesion G protein-coupled receptor E1-like n=1 Tax=Coilia grayii TaxID=363190 RepID=A0ABD1JJ01_9TELE